MSEQVLERFHRALIEEIQTQRPEYLTAPFTVAEIYQNLVPYGSHRDRIGVEMNGDYEDALIRLLAGEGGYLILDSEHALRDLKSELEGANPNTGLYREFAAVDVRLNQAYLDLSAAAMDQLPDLVEELDAEDPTPLSELAPDPGNPTPEDLGIVPPGVDIFDDEPAAAGPGQPMFLPDEERPRDRLAPEFVEETPVMTPPSEPSRAPALVSGPCAWCDSPLPDRDDLNFCPHCGVDVTHVPCTACGSAIEAGWRFCISCGSQAPA